MLYAFGMLTNSILSLSRCDNPRHTNKQQSFKEPLEEIISIDDPKSIDLINGTIKFK